MSWFLNIISGNRHVIRLSSFLNIVAVVNNTLNAWMIFKIKYVHFSDDIVAQINMMYFRLIMFNTVFGSKQAIHY